VTRGAIFLNIIVLPPAPKLSHWAHCDASISPYASNKSISPTIRCSVHVGKLHLADVSRESSPFGIPISWELGSPLVCFWQRSHAIRTALTSAVLPASMPATDRSKKRRRIYGKRCSSFLRGVIKQGFTNLSLGNQSFGHTRRKNRRDDSCRHRFRQLPCAGIETRDPRKPFPQRQVARELYDVLRGFPVCAIAAGGLATLFR
jgi:hypothetical protein